MAPRKRPQHGAAARNRRSTTSGRASGSRTRTPAKPASKSRKKTTSTAKARGTGRPAGNSRALLIPLVVIVLLGVAMWSFYPVARIQYQESREKARLEVELASLKERNAELRTQVDRLKTPAGVEQIARESLGMVKDGEHVYVVTNLLEETTGTVAGCTSISEPPPSFTQSLLDSVFGVEE